MVINTSEHSRMERKMAKEYKFGDAASATKETGEMIYHMGREPCMT